MEIKPSDIIKSLDLKDQTLLNDILNIEKHMLQYSEIKSNSRDEKEIIHDIIALIDKVVEDVN